MITQDTLRKPSPDPQRHATSGGSRFRSYRWTRYLLFAPRTTRDLKKLIYGCGLANFLAFGLLIPLSYGIAAISPFGVRQEQEIAVFHSLLQNLETTGSITSELLKSYLLGESLFVNPVPRALAYTLPLLISTLVFLILMAVLRRRTPLIDDSVISLLLTLSVGFALLNIFIYPMFTQDFWISVVWGRMILDGQNPYYQFFTQEALAGTPLSYFPIRMTYGPLWAMISAALAFLSRRSIVLEFFFFKLALALFWTLSLLIVRNIVAASSTRHRALAICLFGWLPASFHMSVGEGHNDIVMIFFLLVWMYLMLRNRHLLSPLSLAVSVLIKYITAPLAILELAHAWSQRMLARRSYLTALALCAVFTGMAFFPFYEGPDFFSSVTEMRRLEFFTPAHAIVSIAAWFNLPGAWTFTSQFVSILISGLFGGLCLYYGFRYFRNPTFPTLAELTLAFQCAILFAIVGHVWPWFIIWVLAPAAVVAHSGLLWFVVPVAVLGPFLHLYWLLASGWEKAHYGSVAFYGLVVIGMLVTRRGGWIDMAPMNIPDGRPYMQGIVHSSGRG